MSKKTYKLAMDDDQFAASYANLCGYIEAMWANRKKKEYWRVDDEDIQPVVSPQSRATALHIMHGILGIEYGGADLGRPSVRKRAAKRRR